MPDAAPLDEQLAELGRRLAALERERDTASSERDEYKQLYVTMLEAYRKLEAGLVRHHRERVVLDGEQTTLGLLSMLTGGTPTPGPATTTTVNAHERVKPTGRKPLPDHLPRIHVEVLPPDVQRAGLDAFDRIGEDVTETVEHRPAAVVIVRAVRPKYVRKEAVDALKEGESTPVLQAGAPELPIRRALAGPGLLAATIVLRWQDHLPLHRLERIYGRDGLPLARSTICGWHTAVAALASPLVEAMFQDALQNSPYLCTDATGVLVQAPEKCRTGHFFVVVAPGKHVLFQYTPKHDGKAVDAVLGGYRGFLVADAHSVYEHLYDDGLVLEVACWAHARRYVFKSVESDGARARHALALIQALFAHEREWKSLPPEARLKLRVEKSKPLVEAFFRWCDDEALKVLDETPISKAIGYARNRREALCRFLTDGRLPLHNNSSENALRRQALGRRNWLFVGNDDGGEATPRSSRSSPAVSCAGSSPSATCATCSVFCRAGPSNACSSSPPRRGRSPSRARTSSGNSTPTCSVRPRSASSSPLPRDDHRCPERPSLNGYEIRGESRSPHTAASDAVEASVTKHAGHLRSASPGGRRGSRNQTAI